MKPDLDITERYISGWADEPNFP